MSDVAEINGVNVTELLNFRNLCKQDPSRADRNPIMVAHWMGGSRSKVEFQNKVVHLGGDDEFNPMQMFLASLAACDVHLVAMHASLLGIKIESLSIEVTGHFNVQTYLGLEDAPLSGYDGISYTVHLVSPKITPHQITRLRELCERASPVGSSMAAAIPLNLAFEAHS